MMMLMEIIHSEVSICIAGGPVDVKIGFWVLSIDTIDVINMVRNVFSVIIRIL